MNFNFKRPQNYFSYCFSLSEWRVLKIRSRDFWLHFYFLKIGLCYIFVSFEIDAKNRKSFIRLKLHIFFKIAGTVFLSGYIFKCTPFPKELRQRFFKIKLQHYTLTENSLRRLTLFILMYLPDQMTCNNCGIHDIWTIKSPFNLFFLWKF